MLALAFLRKRRKGGDVEVERVGLGGREHTFVCSLPEWSMEVRIVFDFSARHLNPAAD